MFPPDITNQRQIKNSGRDPQVSLINSKDKLRAVPPDIQDTLILAKIVVFLADSSLIFRKCGRNAHPTFGQLIIFLGLVESPVIRD